MGIDTDWTRFLAHPAYFLNLDRRPDRLARTAQALAAAGFTNQHRFAAVDGQTADLPAAFALIKQTYGTNQPSMISFITGPSRTGDIERILVLGAHGPKKLTVLLLP